MAALKRRFWIVHLAFIFALMILLTRIADVFVEAALLPSPAATERRRPVVQPAAAPPARLELLRLSQLTGLPMPPKPSPVPLAPAVDLSATPVRCSLRVRLLGTMLAEPSSYSVASIEDATTLKSQSFMIGDTVQGAELLEIERARVIVLNNHRREFIDATAGDGTIAAPPPSPIPVAQASIGFDAEGAPPSIGLGLGIRPTSEHEYEIPRAEIDRTLSNLNDVAMQARIVPAFRDGVAQGFKLFSIRPDSIYTRIGIRDGDVITRINGYELNSPEKALEIYSKLKEASRIDIDVDRNGAAVRKTYNVR